MLLKAIQNGEVPVTDEMIEAQKRLHPELKGFSNQEIRDRLEKKAGRTSEETVDSTQPKAHAKPHLKSENSNPANTSDQTNSNDAGQTNSNGVNQPGSRFPSDLMRFGYDFFVNNPNSGSAGNNSPALPEYVLSAGDEIQVDTWGRENQHQSVVIDKEGMFHYSPLQPIRLAGLKFEDAQRLLTHEIEKINGIKASVSLGKLRSIRFFVLGEATSPGSYVASAGVTVTSALFQSGGISPIGSLRSIQVKREGRVIATLDLYEMLLKGSNKGDMQLLSGDVIFVPVAAIQVAVTGMVKRPGIYEVKPGTKVLDALDLAGGLSSNAFKGRVRLDRIESHKRKVVLDVGMEKMAGNSNAAILDGDILNVEEVLSREYDVVYLQGNVNRPGRYEYKKGMSIRDLIPGIQDLKSETFFSYGHIKRSTEDNQRAILLPFSLTDVFEKSVSVPLMPRDTVIIYSQYDIMDKPEVKIAGTIRKPGKYPFVNKMKVSDLIIAGGGMSVDAYLPEAHLIRILKIQESDSLFSTLIKVNLANLIDNPGDENNVELHPSDSLIVFPRSNFVLPKSITVNGAVKKSGSFELTQNMGIPEVISQADGLSKNTYKLNVEVVRRETLKDSVVNRKIFRLNLKDIMEGREKFALQDGDAIYLREVVDNGGNIVVNLTGQFNFPGKYMVSSGEKLSSVIHRAGGFTTNAYLPGAVFLRQSVKARQLQAVADIGRRLEDQSNNLLSQTTNEKDRATIQVAINQRKALLQDVQNAPYLGRVVIGLDKELSFEGQEEDLTLEMNDSLEVGPYPNIISIMGEVYSPTNVIYGKDNNTLGKCLDKAGGVGEYGDEKNIYYLRPNGAVLTPKNTSFFRWRHAEPGGTIIVPAKGPRKDYLDDLAKITQIIYQIAISVGVAKTVF